ncbi:MAG TPA: 50S ribosomal protein L11 methyltransferase [Candidatus Saccharimonadales bacterium]|nr:50S ribosomal protein L11 methyltransferase [Candidatus Saccharimonadales bacterium]
MEYFIIVNLILFGIIGILLLLLSGLWPPDSPWAPWWQMPKETVRKMCTLAKVTEKSVIYDLGSGTGNALIIAAKEYGATGIGVEIDPFRYYISKINNKRFHTEKKVAFLKQNFFATPLSEATVIFMYLIPPALKRLTPKFLKEIKSGTMFVSYVYPMPVEMFDKRLKLVTFDKEYRIYVYKMGK